jgi:hypothetical protein
MEKWTTLQNILRDHPSEAIGAHYEEPQSQSARGKSSVSRLPNLSVIQEEASQVTARNDTVAGTSSDFLGITWDTGCNLGGELSRV